MAVAWYRESLPAYNVDLQSGLVMVGADFAGFFILRHDPLVGVGEAAVPLPALAPNAPNPFNPRTRLVFTLPAAGRADLAVYDLAGRLVLRLQSGDLPPGDHVCIWEGDDAGGRPLPSGTYVARLVTAAGVATRKLVLVR